MKNVLNFARIILILAPQLLMGQVNTFNKTYRDTSNLSCTSSRPVEYPVGIYSVASDGSGLSLSEGGYQQIYQVDSYGTQILKKIQYTESRRFQGASQLTLTSSNDFLLAGTRSLLGGTGGNRVFVLKVSPDLSDTLWSYYHSDSTFFDTAAEILQADNGDVYVSARRRPFDNDSMLGVFIRLSADGQLLNKTIIREREVQTPESMAQVEDGNFFIGGARGPANSTDLHGFLMKISGEGQILWSQDYPQITECGMSLYGDDQVILSGYNYSLGTAKMLLLDHTGILIQNKTYFYPGFSAINYIGRKVADGGIVSAGLATKLDFTENDNGFIMKTDLNGNMLWQKDYKYTSGDFNEYFTDFIETSDGSLLISGSASQSNADGGQNSWLIKLDANGCLDPANCGVGIEDAPFPDAVTIYPNPATDWLRIDLETAGSAYTAQLLDATGRVVQQEKFTSLGTHTLSLSGLATGIYYCRIIKGDEVVVVEKVVKVI